MTKSATENTDLTAATRLTPAALRWTCDAAALPFQTTDTVAHAPGVVGQDTAREALAFGVQCDAPKQNIYVRGATGTGRMTLVQRLLDELAPPASAKKDRCYVNNFERPDKPRLIELPAGDGPAFKRLLTSLADFIANDLMKTLEAEPWLSERNALLESAQTELAKITGPLEEDLKTAGFALVPIQQGAVTQTLIFPVVDGQPVPPPQFEQMIAAGKINAERQAEIEQQFPVFQKRLQEVSVQVQALQHERIDTEKQLLERAIRSVLQTLIDDIAQRFPDKVVREHLDSLVRDVVNNRLGQAEDQLPDPVTLYGVNIILTQNDATTRPVIFENTPRLMNLLGTVEPHFNANGTASSDYRGIRGGSLLQADGGYLIVEVKELLSEPGAWRALLRTLRTGQLEIVPPEAGWMRPYVVVQPEPIDIRVRVILIGDEMTYYLLDGNDPDFGEFFKLLVDLDSETDRSAQNIMRYAQVAAHLVNEEKLLPFENTAVAALAEHGARIAARANKITARFGRIADIAREAAFVAKTDQQATVTADHVKRAVKRTRARASGPSRRFQEALNSCTILVATAGCVVGQVNGLAVIRSGPLTYGFPARITATISPGRAGLINIEGQAAMSGSIHTKGFHILGGLLRHLLRLDHPLAFSASIAFEQSYGGIDGDSASGAEACCLISALTNTPLKQSLAMTGAIDQHGRVQAIGGVNEKIEGFFDACTFRGLNGEQGVIIPRTNTGDLMLREDVVRACEAGKFSVFAVETIYQALELFTGLPCQPSADGKYPSGSLLDRAAVQATAYWRNTLASPEQLVAEMGSEKLDHQAPRPIS